MASYAIGDIQGCFQELLDLLALVKFDATSDRLYLVGDLINRGPQSLETLRWVYANRAVVRTVLGNHDLHLLAVHAGVAKAKGRDTLSDILAATDVDEMVTWLRQQPLVMREGRYVFVHAGLPPSWTVEEALACSGEVEEALSSPRYVDFLANMYGNKPVRWRDSLRGIDRLRFIVNACTRMRVVKSNGEMDLAFKGELKDAPADLMAWFDVPSAERGDAIVVCGHWSALGLRVSPSMVGLDTGCVWGDKLTALRLEDGKVFQVPSRQPVCEEWN